MFAELEATAEVMGNCPTGEELAKMQEGRQSSTLESMSICSHVNEGVDWQDFVQKVRSRHSEFPAARSIRDPLQEFSFCLPGGTLAPAFSFFRAMHCIFRGLSEARQNQ